MKICEQCGKELPDFARFCNQCGCACGEAVTGEAEKAASEAVAMPGKPQTAVEISPDPGVVIERLCYTEDHLKKPPIKKKRKILVITAVALVLALVLGLGAVLAVHFLSPRQRILRAWDEGSFDEASAILREDTALCSDPDFSEEMRQRVEALAASYQQGETDYRKTMAGLLAAEGMDLKGLETLLTEVMQTTAAIEISRGFFQEAEVLFEEGKQLEARSLYMQVIEQDIHYAKAQARLKECDETFRQKVLADAEAQAQQEDYPAAISILKEALYTLPGDEALQTQIDYYQEQYDLQQKNELLKQAQALADQKDFVGAMALLSDTEDPDLRAAYEGYYNDYISYIETTVTGQLEEQDYCGAVEAVQAAMEFAPEEERLQKALDSCVDAAIGRSETLMAEKAYEQARAVIKDLRTLLPKNQKLEAQLEKVDAETPLFLTDVSVAFDAIGHQEYMEDTFTMRGTAYSNGFTLQDHGYACYNISAKYTSLTWTVGHVDDTTMAKGYLEVYLDGQLAQTMVLEATGAPQSVTMDITGVRQLKFLIRCTDGEVAENHSPIPFRYGLGEIIVE